MNFRNHSGRRTRARLFCSLRLFRKRRSSGRDIDETVVIDFHNRNELDGVSEIRKGSLESARQAITRDIVPAGRDALIDTQAHEHGLDPDVDQGDVITGVESFSQHSKLCADRIGEYGFRNKACAFLDEAVPKNIQNTRDFNGGNIGAGFDLICVQEGQVEVLEKLVIKRRLAGPIRTRNEDELRPHFVSDLRLLRVNRNLTTFASAGEAMP